MEENINLDEKELQYFIENGEQKHVKVVEEFIVTELSYISDINSIIKNYLIPFSKPPWKGEYNEIFSNIEELSSFSTKLAQQMKIRMRDPELFSQIFLGMADDFKRLYGSYCVDYDNAMAKLAESEEIIEFKETLDQIKSRLGQKLSLSSYLLKPIQRILKYQLLFKSLVVSLEKASMPFSSSLESQIKMEDIASEINIMKKEHENKTRYMFFKNNLLDIENFEIENTGDFIKQFNALMGGYREVEIILFEKCVVIAESSGEDKTTKMIFSIHQTDFLVNPKKEKYIIFEFKKNKNTFKLNCKKEAREVYHCLVELKETFEKYKGSNDEQKDQDFSLLKIKQKLPSLIPGPTKKPYFNCSVKLEFAVEPQFNQSIQNFSEKLNNTLRKGKNTKNLHDKSTFKGSLSSIFSESMDFNNDKHDKNGTFPKLKESRFYLPISETKQNNMHSCSLTKKSPWKNIEFDKSVIEELSNYHAPVEGRIYNFSTRELKETRSTKLELRGTFPNKTISSHRQLSSCSIMKDTINKNSFFSLEFINLSNNREDHFPGKILKENKTKTIENDLNSCGSQKSSLGTKESDDECFSNYSATSSIELKNDFLTNVKYPKPTQELPTTENCDIGVHDNTQRIKQEKSSTNEQIILPSNLTNILPSDISMKSNIDTEIPILKSEEARGKISEISLIKTLSIEEKLIDLSNESNGLSIIESDNAEESKKKIMSPRKCHLRRSSPRLSRC